MSHERLIVSWAFGAGSNLAKAKNHKDSWGRLKKMLRTTLRTNETYKTYMSLNRDEQLRLKSTNGWVSGAQCDGEWRNLRNVKPRDLMTLDLDYPRDSFWDLLETGVQWVAQFESIAITTRSHSPDAQRYRMVLPMARMVSPEEYGPLVRIVAFLIDGEQQPMKQVDKVSARKAQMMFLPTSSKDGEFKVMETEGRLLDPDEIFAYWRETVGDPMDIMTLPLFDGEEKLRKHADKAEDPWLKPGMIGNWCRAWPIEDAIAEFLSDVYVPGDSQSGKPRYTYTQGSASNGAVVEDDGRFLYSHHGTDPVGEQLVNAWDLIRIHFFGREDDAKDVDKPVSERSSSKKMREFVKTDKRYMAEVLKSRYDQAAMFDDADVGSDEEFEDEPEYTEQPEAEPEVDPDIQADIDDLVGDGPAREQTDGAANAADRDPPKKPGKKRPKNPNDKTWFGEELDIDQNGNIRSNVHNVAAIVYNDARFYGAIRYDEFARIVRLFHDIRSKTENVPGIVVLDKVAGDRWQQHMHVTVRAILATPNGPGKVGYGLGNTAERDIADGVDIAARRNRFHPIKEDLERVEWDGVPRMERLFIDYLGVPDTPYARETARLALVASVVRIYEPGHKYDFACILQGAQGVLKSTFVRTLYGSEYFGEIDCQLSDTQKIAEIIGGKWGVELPELTSFSKSDHNDAKQFMTRQTDVVRFAYAREVSVLPRQIVVWGTTNDPTYLKDPTGNRRYWPQVVTVPEIDVAALAEARSQIWAEALATYRAMRAEQPEGELYLALRDDESRAEALRLQEGAREHGMAESWTEAIEEWLDTPVKLGEFANSYDRDPASFVEKGTSPDDIWVKRVVFSPKDAATAINVEWPGKNNQTVPTMTRALSRLRGWHPDREGERYRRWGTSNRVWFAKDELTVKDLARGYVIVPAPEHHDAEFTNYGFTDEDLGPDPDLDDLV